MWEQGAASFDRVDQWSDIDLMLVVYDNKIEDAFKVTEKALLKISSFKYKYRIPEPAWHGHSQCFYFLKNTNPFMFLDLCIMKKTAKDKFLQYSIHGLPQVVFDKAGIVKDDRVDKITHLKKIEERIKFLKVTFPLFQVEVLKELNRNNDIEAFSFYLGTTFRPLVEVLRIKYTPYHYNFHTRYVYYELPDAIVKRLQKLLFIPNGKALRIKQKEAEKWFLEIIDSIDIKAIKAALDN